MIADPASFSGSLLGAFETLSKRLRNIKEIPLKISSVQPLDPGSLLFNAPGLPDNACLLVL